MGKRLAHFNCRVAGLVAHGVWVIYRDVLVPAFDNARLAIEVYRTIVFINRTPRRPIIPGSCGNCLLVHVELFVCDNKAHVFGDGGISAIAVFVVVASIACDRAPLLANLFRFCIVRNAPTTTPIEACHRFVYVRELAPQKTYPKSICHTAGVLVGYIRQNNVFFDVHALKTVATLYVVTLSIRVSVEVHGGLVGLHRAPCWVIRGAVFDFKFGVLADKGGVRQALLFGHVQDRFARRLCPERRYGRWFNA